jgi:SAM-dependent methyltransferase
MDKDNLIIDPLLEFTQKSKQYYQNRVAFWNNVAQKKFIHGIGSSTYYERLQELYQFHIAPDHRVIEIGCGEGDLLASVQPSYGLGVDFSNNMIQRARQRHPALDFICADGIDFRLGK